MKSQKAEKELYDGSWKVEVGFEDEEFDLPYYAVRVDVAQYAIEIAEQEAEERMREKAIKAFKASCKYQGGCLGADRKCDQTQCADLNEFIRKLNEK